MIMPVSSTHNWNLRQLFKMNEKGTLNFDMAVQRNANVWSNSQKSLLIDSYLQGYPVPPTYAVKEEDGTYSFLDGKQRLTSTFQFLRDEFKIEGVDLVTFEGEEYDIEGKLYSELPENLKDEILSKTLTIYKFEEITQEEIEEMFKRLNNGVALTKFELTRIQLGADTREFIMKVTETEFFNRIKLSTKQINRYVDQELVLQVLSMLTNESPSFSSKDLRAFAEGLGEIDEEVKNTVFTLTEYLNSSLEGIEEKITNKFLKKTHIPIMFKVAQDVKDTVSPQEFGKKIVHFFTVTNKKVGTRYRNASASGSAKKENIAIRYSEMLKAMREELVEVSE